MLGKFCLIVAASFGSYLGFAQPVEAGRTESRPSALKGAPVVFDNRRLFSLSAPVGSFSPADRATAVAARLAALSRDPVVRIGKLAVVDADSASDIFAGDVVIMSVTEADARAAGQDRKQLASKYASQMQAALEESRRQHGVRSTVIEILLALLATAALILLLRLSSTGLHWLLQKVDSWRNTRIRSIRIQQVELLSARRITGLLSNLFKVLRFAAAGALFYFYALLVLGLFPWSRGVSSALIQYLRDVASLVLGAVTTQFPNVAMILIIGVITRYVIAFCRFIFAEMGAGTITLPGFYPEWADPTYKIARFLILAFAAVVVFPYFPGHDSPALRGVSIFVGVLLSLGSAGAVSNIIAGVLLTYTRAFEIGDRVKVADTMGDVLGKTLLATRIRTIKNEDVTVPNSLVLGSHIVNFSACAAGSGLILHTSITIGYDAPWRHVQQLLIRATLATQGVLQTPKTFVLQTALNDFYVVYEINAYTKEPSRMAAIYAEIHQNIQDKFNEAGVEICSPHFAAVRDSNHIAIPPEYVPDGYVPPAFRVQTRDGNIP